MVWVFRKDEWRIQVVEERQWLLVMIELDALRCDSLWFWRIEDVWPASRVK